MFRTRVVALLAVLGCCVLPARAEEEPRAGETRADEVITRSVDLRRFRTAEAPRGPRLSLPTDLIAHAGDETDPNIWNIDYVFEDTGTWLPFEEAHLDTWALSFDSVVELLKASVQGDPSSELELDIAAVGQGLELEGRRSLVDAALKRLPWILEGLAPSIEVSAVLTRTPAGEPDRLQAMGSVRLWPGRWTRVYLQENHVPFTVRWDLEVAQEATAMDPTPIPVSEGQELYLRYHPGEGVSLVEVWSGDTEHLEVVRQDLSVIRNIPEANAPGVLSFPRTAVNRAFAAVLLPTGEAVTRVFDWHNQGRATRLRLDFTAPSAAPPRLPLGERGALAILRGGTVGAGLEFEAREQSTEVFIEHISRVLYRAGESYEQRGQSFEFSVSTVDGGSVFLLDAPAAEMERARAVIVEAERALKTHRVSLKVLAVPEATYRMALGKGAVGVGRVLPAEILRTFRASGASEGESITIPVLSNMRVGFRVGQSVPGMLDLNTEIAQQSAGLYATTSARFDGLFGEMRLRSTPSGYALRVRGSLCWADTSAGLLEFTLRPPLSMSGVSRGAGPSRKVKLPVLGGGVAPVDKEIEIAGSSREQHIVHAYVRGSEVLLLLAAIR